MRERCGNLTTPSHTHSFQNKMEEGNDGVDIGMKSPTRSPKGLCDLDRDEETAIFLPDLQYQNPPPEERSRTTRRFEKRTSTRKNTLLDRTSQPLTYRAETRRKLFLSSVAKKRDDEKWQRRNGGEGEDELMRVLWSGERAREIARLQSEAQVTEEILEQGEGEEEMHDEVDEVAQWETAELEALLAQRDVEVQRRMQAGDESIYGSDDDEYDSIFQDVIEEEMRMSQSQSHPQSQQQQQQQQIVEYQDMMDLS